MLLAISAAGLLSWLSSTVYRRALVVTGRRLRLTEVLRTPA
jgi:hypothetical protein